MARGGGWGRVVIAAITGLVVLGLIIGIAVGTGGRSTPITTQADDPNYGNTDTDVPWTTGPAKSTSAVRVIHLDPSTNQQLVAAFDVYNDANRFDSVLCPVTTLPRQVWLGTIRHTGQSWAVAAFKEQPACRSPQRDINGNPVPPTDMIPFGTEDPPVDVFERDRKGKWVDNSESGWPFPCPGEVGHGSPAVPAQVLQAWRMPYFSLSCVPEITDQYQ